MTKVGSLQELGEIFCWAGDTCIGDIYKVPDEVRGIATTAYWHPGILCQWNSHEARFSMGTDFMNINYKDMANYFLVRPTEENGLRKSTGFSRFLTAISKSEVSSLSTIGNLGNGDCEACLGRTLSEP